MPIVDQIPTPAGDIIVLRFGQSGAGPRVYLQGALHADEVSATLALHYLGNLLTTAEGEDRLRGEVILAPHCNPAGLNQFSLGEPSRPVRCRRRPKFQSGLPRYRGQDHRQAIPYGRQAYGRQNGDRDRCGNSGPGRKRQSRRPVSAGIDEAFVGADIVIDVHADMEAAVHMYSSAASWPQLRGLAERLAAKAVILCDISADRPFDEAHSHSWSQVERFLIGQGVEPERGVASCTVELRGLADVTPRLAEADAAAFYDYLVSMGVVAPAENHRADFLYTSQPDEFAGRRDGYNSANRGLCPLQGRRRPGLAGGRSGAGLRSDGSRSRSGMGVVESNQ